MTSLTYRGVTFTILRSISWEREPIYDPSGATYLYTRWRGNVILTYGPGAAAFAGTVPPIVVPGYAPFGGGRPPVSRTGAIPAVLPAATDVAVRAWLERPRGQLVVLSGGTTVIISPPALAGGLNAPCDAANGPFIRVNSIVAIQGERRWDIHCTIETSIIETPTPSVIISNRWSCTGDTTWQQNTVRTYQGLCTVRADALRTTIPPAAIPTTFIDALRRSFAAFTVPQNFQRVGVTVRVMPDGNSCEYTVVDAEQFWNKGESCPAVKLDIQDSGWVTKGSAARMVFGFDIPAALPKANRRVHVRAWGHARRDRVSLVRYAMLIATTRMGGPSSAVLDIATENLIVAQDTNNYVDVSLVRSWDYTSLGTIANISALIVMVATGALPEPPGTVQFRNSILAVPTYTAAGYVAVEQNPGGGLNPPFINDGGTRGTWLGYLIAQTLENPDAAPGSPP